MSIDTSLGLNLLGTSGVSQTSTSQTGSATSSTEAQQPDKEMFLKLLVAQLRYQDPLQPVDGIQFVTQLAQFTEVEQLMGMRQDISSIASALLGSTNVTPAADSN